MRNARRALVGLLLVVPLTFACDSGATGTAVATVVPTSVGGAIEATATALPGAISSGATEVATNVSGAATAATTAVTGSLTDADRAYLTQVNALAMQMSNSAELKDALNATATAAATGATGGTVDTAGLTDKLNKAGTFINDMAGKAAALQPTPNLQAVQDSLMKATTDWQAGITAATGAVGSQNWAAVGQAATQMGQGASELVGVLADMALRGIR